MTPVHDPESRILIPHIDDVGMNHGANLSCLELMGRGFITTASVMVPCPWFPEIADASKERPELDLGVHLTLTSEWKQYRWRPISTASRSSGLMDDEGFMWRSVVDLRRHMDVSAAEEEMRAQIEAAYSRGMDPTHLDTHMGAAAVPELVDIYRKLGRAYRLPILLPREVGTYLSVLKMGEAAAETYTRVIDQLDAEGALFVDRFIMTPKAPPEESAAVYRRMVEETTPGVTFFSVHCNLPVEMEAIDPAWAVIRADEHRICGDPAYHAFVRDQGIELMGYRPFRERYRKSLGSQ